MLISIDPGINNCGLSVLDLNGGFTVKETYLIKNARKFTEEEKVIEAKFGIRAVKVIAIISRIKDILNRYSGVDTIIIEAPFYNALTPSAYGSLLEIIFSIKYIIVIPNELKLELIEPLLIKKLFSGQHMAKKSVMRQFLINRISTNEIKFDYDCDIESLSEHEVDSIAIGFIHYCTMLEKAKIDN